MGSFFVFGGDDAATKLINYEASLPPRTEDCNIKGFSCYNAQDYNTLKSTQKDLLAQGQKKKLLEVTEEVVSTDAYVTHTERDTEKTKV